MDIDLKFYFQIESFYVGWANAFLLPLVFYPGEVFKTAKFGGF
jgi:hypothetical protein